MNLKNNLKSAVARIWQKALQALVLGAALAACGGADLGTDDDLGSVEQELTAAHPSYGVSNAASHTACNDSNAGQACLVPRLRNYVWCAADFTWSTQEIADIRAGFALANQKFTNRFSFTELTGVSQCTQVSPPPQILVKKGTCSAGGSTSGIVEAFLCTSFQPVFAVTESVPGSWQSHGGGILTIDTVDVNAQPANANFFTSAAQEQSCLRVWGVAHSAFAMVGLGATNSASSGFDPFSTLVTDRQLHTPPSGGTPTSICYSGGFVGNFFVKHDQISSQQNCEMRAYNDSSPGTFAFNATTCP